MQIKNKIFLIIFSFLNLFLFCLNISAEEFNISAQKISVDKKNNIIIGEGSVEVTDKQGKLIKSDKVTYEKSIEFLKVEGSVEIFDLEGNTLKTDKATYDKLKDIIITYKNSELTLNKGYKLISNSIFYNNNNKKISSDQHSILTDSDNNIVMVDMFEYSLKEKIFSSVGKIKIIDAKKNVKITQNRDFWPLEISGDPSKNF